MVITTVKVTRSDPTDPTIAFHHDKQVIDVEEKDAFIANRANFYCNVCDAFVIEYTKHCVECNRCCADFDHHCKWIANDIGRLNYVVFLRMCLFVAITLSLHIV